MAQSFTAPSGLELEMKEVLMEPDTDIARFRFVAPTLGQEGVMFEDVASDLLWICESLALPALAQNAWQAERIIVSVSDREVPFGTMDVEATQYFEGFSQQGDGCLVEVY